MSNIDKEKNSTDSADICKYDALFYYAAKDFKRLQGDLETLQRFVNNAVERAERIADSCEMIDRLTRDYDNEDAEEQGYTRNSVAYQRDEISEAIKGNGRNVFERDFETLLKDIATLADNTGILDTELVKRFIR